MGKRLTKVFVLAMAMSVFGASAAWAGDCYVVKKPDNAGTHVVVDVDKGTITGLTPSGKLRGGFYDVVFDGVVVANDIMLVSIHSMSDPYSDTPDFRYPKKFGPIAVGGLRSPVGIGVDLAGF